MKKKIVQILKEIHIKYKHFISNKVKGAEIWRHACLNRIYYDNKTKLPLF